MKNNKTNHPSLSLLTFNRASPWACFATAMMLVTLGLAAPSRASDTLSSRLLDEPFQNSVPLDASPFGSDTFHIVAKRLGAELVLRTFDIAQNDFHDTFVLDAGGGGVDAANAVDKGRVVWISGDTLRIRKFRDDGNPDGGAQAVVSPAVDISAADVAVTADGRTLVVWAETRVPENQPVEFLVFGRFFEADLTPDGDAFEIDDEALAPKVTAVGDEFAVAWKNSNILPPQVARLTNEGSKAWQRPIDGPFLGSVLGLADGRVMVSYSDDDAYVKIYSSEGGIVAGSTYRLSLPRDDVQTAPTLGPIGDGGRFVATAYHSAALSGLLEYVHLNDDAAPVAATPPLVDNARLDPFAEEKICRFRPVIAAGGPAGGPVAVFYSASSETTANNPTLGCSFPTGRMVLLPVAADGSGPPCPGGVSCTATAEFQQDQLVPYRTAGPASRRINVVLRPSAYDLDTREGRRKFLRELRTTVVNEIFFGSRQHREHHGKMNFLYQLTDAGLRNTNPSFLCPFPFDGDITEFQMAYPWVYAVGGQMNRDFYTNVLSWCAEPGGLANGGGYFIYPAGIWTPAGVFEHELAHAIYGVFDEYPGGGYGEPDPPAPHQHQWLTEQECRDAATADGAEPNDCRLACLPNQCDHETKEWYTYEFSLRDLSFNNQASCLEWLAEHPNPGATCIARGTSSGDWIIPALFDLMAINRDGTAKVDPTNRTLDMSRPSESFQRACQQRPLAILTDPILDP